VSPSPVRNETSGTRVPLAVSSDLTTGRAVMRPRQPLAAKDWPVWSLMAAGGVSNSRALARTRPRFVSDLITQGNDASGSAVGRQDDWEWPSALSPAWRFIHSVFDEQSRAKLRERSGFCPSPGDGQPYPFLQDRHTENGAAFFSPNAPPQPSLVATLAESGPSRGLVTRSRRVSCRARMARIVVRGVLFVLGVAWRRDG